MTAEVALETGIRATRGVPQWFAVDNVEFANQICCLHGTIRVQVAICDDPERQPRVIADHRTKLPSPQEGIAPPARGPRLPLAHRRSQYAVDLDVVGAV